MSFYGLEKVCFINVHVERQVAVGDAYLICLFGKSTTNTIWYTAFIQYRKLYSIGLAGHFLEEMSLEFYLGVCIYMYAPMYMVGVWIISASAVSWTFWWKVCWMFNFYKSVTIHLNYMKHFENHPIDVATSYGSISLWFAQHDIKREIYKNILIAFKKLTWQYYVFFIEVQCKTFINTWSLKLHSL